MTERYRLEWRQMPWPYLVVFGVILFRAEAGAADRALAAAILLVAFAAICVWLRARTGLELTPEALTIHRFGRRVVPWHRVGAVAPQRLLGTTSLRIMVDGAWVLVRVPQHTPFVSPDPHFAEKVATIERYRDAANAAPPPAPKGPR